MYVFLRQRCLRGKVRGGRNLMSSVDPKAIQPKVPSYSMYGPSNHNPYGVPIDLCRLCEPNRNTGSENLVPHPY